MLKKSTLLLLIAIAFCTNTFGHNPLASDAPLREFLLKNNRHLHASFLMMRQDSAFLETENNTIRAFQINDFSKNDQQFFDAKMAEIVQINQPSASKTVQFATNQNVSKTKNGSWTLLLLCLVPFVAAFQIFKKSKKWSLATVLFGAVILMSFNAGNILGTDPHFLDAAFQPFKPHVATHWDANWFYVESNGIPTTHLMMTGITKWQQQVPIPQCYTGTNAWQIPLNPTLAAQPVPVNDQHFLRGAVAIAANGIPIFNPHTNTGVDAFLDGQLDQWGGHSGRADDYHYHIAPLFLDTQTVDILPIAFALDGFAVYGSQEPDGSPMLPLDANHGHFDAMGVYHYHGTPEAPYMIGNMVGQVTEDATMQIIPQARAQPVRPSLTPLSGATITDFQKNGNLNGFILTYTRSGQTYKVDYSWTPAGVYTYKFISPNGTTMETYNGQPPCTSLVSTYDYFEKTVDVAVFPNPTSASFFLKINGSERVSLRSISIFQMNGRLVFQKENPGDYFEISGLAGGVYLAKIQFEKGEISRKIIIQ